MTRQHAPADAQPLKYRHWSDEECEVKRQRAIALNLGRHLVPGYHGPWWTAEELALVGTLPDAEVAERIGRTVEAVRKKRCQVGLPTAKDKRKNRPRC